MQPVARSTPTRCAIALGLALGPLALAQPACGGPEGTGAPPDAGSGASPKDAAYPDDDGGLSFVPDGGAEPDTGFDFDATCSAATAKAELVFEKADIILAVDNSASMKEEVASTNANLNEFARIIDASKLDYHVIMISKKDPPRSATTYSVCIPSPLAGARCGDGPRFHHVDQEIYSTKVLKEIVRTYKGEWLDSAGKYHPDPTMSWKGFLRPDAKKHFLVITDDNSTDFQMGATEFDSTLGTLDPPMFKGYAFHAICGLDKATCPTIATVGQAYIDLAAKTKGQTASICDKDWKALFTKMAQGVVTSSKLACEFPVPPPPPGRSLATSKVSVLYTPSKGGAPIVIALVASATVCGTTPGFYFDDPAAPKRIILCPRTCATIQADPAAKVDVRFGCATDVW